MQDAAREYVRVTPSRSNLAPGTVVEQLGGLHGLGAGSDGVLSSLTDRGSNEPPTFEFLALSEVADEAVEFYYGVEDRLDALEERLRTLYPPAFAVERVTVTFEDGEYSLSVEAGETTADRFTRLYEGLR